MLWKCVYDITWDGELSGCTFEEDVDREVGLLYFVFSGNETVVGGKMSGILAEVHGTCSSAQVHSIVWYGMVWYGIVLLLCSSLLHS